MNRKDEHVSLARAFHKAHTNDFDAVRLVHRSFPECALREVNIGTELFSRKFSAPFFINAMTGGSAKAKKFNQQLAQVANATGLMMATGSVTAALKEAAVADSYTIVRQTFPEGFLLANVGAGTTPEDARKAVDLFQADALQIHLNAPQELVMPEGDRDFNSWLKQLTRMAEQVEVPVIVKEVGFGMTRETIKSILAAGIKTIDVAGAGGTSFTQIENARRRKREFKYLENFGQSTIESLLEANEVAEKFNLIASGGIRNAFDIFKALCFGAKTVGISATLLNHLMSYGPEATIDLIEQWKMELTTLYTMVGARNTTELSRVPLILSGKPLEWCYLRQIDPLKYSTRKDDPER